MNARVRTRIDMIKRAGDFGAANAADYTTPVTVSPAQTKAQTLFAALNDPATGLIARLAANATAQASSEGEFHGGTTSKTVLRDALMLELRGLNLSAEAIATETHDPGLMDKFRMPHGVSDLRLAADARAFGLAATPLSAQFIDLGHEPTFLADLEAHVVAFENADTEQNDGEEDQVGATAGFGPLIADALAKIKSLNAIMHNLYKANAVKLAAWRTASHVERQPKAKQTPPTPPPPKP